MSSGDEIWYPPPLGAGTALPAGQPPISDLYEDGPGISPDPYGEPVRIDLEQRRIARSLEELDLDDPELEWIECEALDRHGQLVFKRYPVVPGVDVCEVCNLQHVTSYGKLSCGGHTKFGQPCRITRRYDANCRNHMPPTVRNKKIRERLARDQAEQSLKQVGIVPIGNPIDELYELAAEVTAVKNHFADLVGQLNDQYRFTDDKGAEQLDARVALYERGLDRCHKVLTDVAKLDIEEKRLQLDERRAQQVFIFTNGVLLELGHSIDDLTVRNAYLRWAQVLDGYDPPPPRELEGPETEADDEAIIEAELVD